MIKVKECKYCDGTMSGYLYGDDEPKVCSTCGAEWEPIEVEYPDDYFDDIFDEDNDFE